MHHTFVVPAKQGSQQRRQPAVPPRRQFNAVDIGEVGHAIFKTQRPNAFALQLARGAAVQAFGDLQFAG